MDGEPLDVDAALFQSLPRIVVSREFLKKSYNFIAGLPVDAKSDSGDAFRCILDQRDLGGFGFDEAGGGGAETRVDAHPAVVVIRTVQKTVVGELPHRGGGAQGEGGDGGMIEIDVFAGDRELITPQRGQRFFATHSSNYTLLQMNVLSPATARVYTE